MEIGFIKLMRSEETLELIKNPYAFALYTQISLRAKRTNSFSVHGLKQGEAFIGDYENCGLTESKYRTAKKHLEQYEIASFRGTNRGTIAKITTTAIYDPNIEDNDEQKTSKSRSSINPITTNKNERMQERKENNLLEGFEVFWKAYPKKIRKDEALIAFEKIDLTKNPIEDIMAGLERAKATEQWTKENGQFRPQAAKWLNDKAWKDEYPNDHNTRKTTHPKLDEIRRNKT